MNKYLSGDEVLLMGQKAITAQAPSKKLLLYLKKFQKDELSTGTSEGMPSFIKQHDSLVAIIRKQYAEGHGYHQTIVGHNFDIPKFWELVLSMDFVSHEIKLTGNIGYDNGKIGAGIYSTIKAPYAEFTITGEGLKSEITSNTVPSIVDSPLEDNPKDQETESQSVSIGMTIEGVIYAEIDGEENRLIKKVRRDSSAYNFMNYMLGHQKQDIARGIIQTEAGCAGKKDMTELAKLCGFTKPLHPLKEVYFGGTTRTKARFRATANLTSDYLELLLQLKTIIA